MYYFSTINDNLGGVSTLYHTVHDNAFCIVIETNDYDIRTQNEKIGVHELLAEAFRLIEIDTPIRNIPSEFANKLDSVLRESNRNPKKGASTEANFTGVALTKNRIYVCSAGISRVHLIQEKRLLKITRDHNYMDDLLSKADLKRDINFEQDSIVFLTPTRTLGIESSENKPPESVVWEIEGDYTVLICSSRYHKFRKPGEYINSFVDTDPSEIINKEKNYEGFLALIKRSNENFKKFEN